MNLNRFKKNSVDHFFICIGILFVIFGFVSLSFVNRMATNWAGYVSPLSLLSGWILISIALWRLEK